MIIIQLHADALCFQSIVKNPLVENLVIYVVNIESFWFCLESKTFPKPKKIKQYACANTGNTRYTGFLQKEMPTNFPIVAASHKSI